MTINRTHLAGLELALELWQSGEFSEPYSGELKDLITQAQAAPEAEPVACWLKSKHPGADIVVLGRPEDIHAAAADTKIPLYAAPQHDAELVELLRDQMTWHEARDKELSKSGRSDADYHWRRLQHQEQIAMIDAKLATLSAKNEVKS